MCYSAQIVADYRRYVREWGAELSIAEFVKLVWRRWQQDPKVRIPKGMEAAFADPRTDAEHQIKAAIDGFGAGQAQAAVEEIFAQKSRRAEAERKLRDKPTKAAAESLRIATNKIEAAEGRLADLRRSEPTAEDSRIYPKYYAPVLIVREGRRLVVPMRYQCRPAGKPADHDLKFPGTFNARRDSLEGYWRGQFGRTHGIALWSAFYENVNRHKVEGRDLADGETPQNVVLEFKPDLAHDMLVACLYSHWKGADGDELWSFAAITDEPPPEVLAAGHDRCIIPIKPEHVDAWLSPDAKDLQALYAILDDRERPYYRHLLAA